MNIRDIAALIELRNYAFFVRENKNIFKGDVYRQVNTKIEEIDKFLSSVIIDFDISLLKTNEKSVGKPENKPDESQLSLDFDKTSVAVKKDQQKLSTAKKTTSKKTTKKKPVKKNTSSNARDLSSDEDLELINNRISEEKKKLAEEKNNKDV